VGKTALSLAWAKQNKGEILSCDSVSCYRGLDVGSAKPDDHACAAVKHHGINLVNVNEVFDVGRYHEYARCVVEHADNNCVQLLVVGGSGFFMQGFLRPVVDGMDVSEEIRKKVDGWYAEEGLKGCVGRLRELNPSGLLGIDLCNQARVRKALERCLQTGKEIAMIRQEFNRLPKPYAGYEKMMVWLDRENEDIEERIERRTQKMLQEGMIEETQRALESGMSEHPSLCNAVGYREVRHYLEGKTNIEELKQSISVATRKLVSKQRKWFRKRFPPQARRLILPEEELTPEDLNWVAGT